MRRFYWIGLVLAVLLTAGCRQQAQEAEDSGVTIDLRTEPEDAAVGEATLIVTVTDAAGSPITDADVSARGDMNHAGMVPVLGEAETAEAENGKYTIPFEWTMAGDWFVEVTVELPDGATMTETFDLSVMAGDAEAMPDMDMGTDADIDADSGMEGMAEGTLIPEMEVGPE